MFFLIPLSESAENVRLWHGTKVKSFETEYEDPILCVWFTELFLDSLSEGEN